MKALLNFLPVILFAINWKLGGIFEATKALIAGSAITVLGFKLLDKRWHKLHLITFALALIMGGITLALHDAAFIKLKLSILYGALSIALLQSNFIGNTVLLKRIPQQTLLMPDALWRRVNLAWGLFLLVLAALNYYVAHYLSEAVWVQMKLYGFSVLTILFMLAHLPFIGRYVVQPEEAAKP